MGDTKVSPVISDSIKQVIIYVPTLALSKSGIRVEVMNFLSACLTSSPVLIYYSSIDNITMIVNDLQLSSVSLSHSVFHRLHIFVYVRHAVLAILFAKSHYS